MDEADEYEKQIRSNIKENQQLLESLGLNVS